MGHPRESKPLHEDALATPAIGQQAREEIEERNEAAVAGSHQPEGRLIKPETP